MSELPSKRRRVADKIEMLATPVQDLDLSLLPSVKRAERAKKTKGHRCPYCGVKLLFRSCFENFTLEDHLKQSKECSKDYVKAQLERINRKSSPLERGGKSS